MSDTITSKLTIGIATFNSSEVIGNCLQSIISNYGDSVKIIVADNNSTDSTHEIITSRFPQVQVYNSGANYGFGYSVNSIVGHSETPFVLILNADIELQAGTIEPLIEALEKEDSLIVAAPVTFDKSGKLEGNIRRFPTVPRQFSESILGGSISRKINLSETIDDENSYLISRNVDWLKGAIWCVRSKSFMELNGMRTDFFLYSEETEFAKRANDSNLLCAIITESKATHIGGESDTNKLLYTLLTLNKLHYFKIRERKIAFVAMLKILIIGMLLRSKNEKSRFAFISLVRAIFGFEKERLRIIELLGGVLPSQSGL